MEKLKGEKFDELISLCDQEVTVTPPTPCRLLALLMRGTMFQLMSQLDRALQDFNEVLNEENLEKKVFKC